MMDRTFLKLRDEKKLKSPVWHEAVLKDRAEAFAAGRSTVSEWDQAKKRIKKRASCRANIKKYIFYGVLACQTRMMIIYWS